MRWGIVVLRGITGMALIALPSATTGGQRTTSPKTIHIVAERFAFTPSEISVEEGTQVELRISSDDTSHGFRLTGPGDSGNPAAIDLECSRADSASLLQVRTVGRGLAALRRQSNLHYS